MGSTMEHGINTMSIYDRPSKGVSRRTLTMTCVLTMYLGVAALFLFLLDPRRMLRMIRRVVRDAVHLVRVRVRVRVRLRVRVRVRVRLRVRARVRARARVRVRVRVRARVRVICAPGDG